MRAEFAAARGKLEDAFTALGDAVEGGLVDRVWMEGCAALREMRGGDEDLEAHDEPSGGFVQKTARSEKRMARRESSRGISAGPRRKLAQPGLSFAVARARAGRELHLAR